MGLSVSRSRYSRDMVKTMFRLSRLLHHSGLIRPIKYVIEHPKAGGAVIKLFDGNMVFISSTILFLSSNNSGKSSSVVSNVRSLVALSLQAVFPILIKVSLLADTFRGFECCFARTSSFSGKQWLCV